MTQLGQLLGSDASVAALLLCGTNNNGSTPLLVAASGIRSEEDADVFRRLLRAAKAAECCLALTLTTHKGVWLRPMLRL